MNEEEINHVKVKNIVRFSYQQFRLKDNSPITRNEVINKIVSKIKEELGKDGN